MQNETLREILSQIKLDNLTEHIHWLTENTPCRIAGTEDEKRAAEYINAQMQNFGLETELQCFKSYNSFPGYSKIEIIEPVYREISSLACAHIVSTEKEGCELELVYVASGGYDDYKNIGDVKGKAVLVEVSYAPAMPEKARIACGKGAAAIVSMNWGSGQDVISHRALKGVWGNPTEETFERIPQIIGAGVTQNDGHALRELCLSGPVKLRITAQARTDWSDIYQPKGILRGNGKRKEFILVGSHYDAWKPGVTCNATGNATTLEIARILAKHKDALDRDIWFVFFSGHEIAEATGSTWLLDNYWDEINKNCTGLVIIDSTGLAEAELYEIKASDEYRDFAANIAADILDEELRVLKLAKIGDQSFMGIGVPGIAQRMSYTKEYMDKNSGATLGWWNHTIEDGLDKYDNENIMKDTRALSALLYNMSNVAILPYEFSNIFTETISLIEALSDKYGAHLTFCDLLQNLREAKELCASIQSKAKNLTDKNAELYDRYMLQISRHLTNALRTYADKYQQDSYGITKLSKPLPLLADLERLEGLDTNSFEYGMIHTQIIKNKNRINDAVNIVIELSRAYALILTGN